MPFTAINSNTYLLFSKSDKNSGRCRVNRKTFAVLKASIGSVAQIRLKFDVNSSCDVLCTLWPDRDDNVQESELCLDPSVVLSGHFPENWTSCLSDVVQVSPQKSCSSIYIHPVNIGMKDFEKISSASLLGLPVAAGCSATCVFGVGGVVTVRLV